MLWCTDAGSYVLARRALAAKCGRCFLSVLAVAKRSNVRHAAIVIVLAIAARAATAACPDFAGPVGYPAGSFTFGLATGDFNSDGNADLVLAGANHLSLRFGDGNGGFGPLVPTALPFSAAAIVAGDFNRDGKTDVAIATTGGGYATALGDGTGGFTITPATPLPSASGRLLAADLSRDGKLDLLSLHSNNDAAYVLIGAGDGTFSAPASLAVEASPRSAAISDLNRDGIPDLAIGNFLGNSIGVYIGAGNGTFVAPVFYGVGEKPTHVSAGDFNGDGVLDLATPRGIPGGAMLLGAGDGTFAPFSETGPGGGYTQAGDFNRDGKTDLATMRAQNLTISLGNGAGVLDGGTDFFVSNSLPALSAMADFNNDALPDFAFLLTNDVLDRNVMVLLNTSVCTANCALVDGNVRLTPSDSPRRVVTADFDRDGRPDLFTTNGSSTSLFLGTAGGFAAPLNRNVGSAGNEGVVVADMNRDGIPDAVVSNTNTLSVSVLTGDGGGGFTENDMPAFFTPGDVVVGDFNRDGLTDIIVGKRNASTGISIWINGGSGTFSTSTVFTATNPLYFAPADFNRDGNLDLAYTNVGSSNLAVRLGNGGGGFGTATPFPAGSGPEHIVAADFNRDGKLDLAVTNIGLAPGVSILFGDGAGSFAAPVAYATPQGAGGIAVGDVNRDGNLDYAVANGQVVTLMAGTAAGTFAKVQDYSTGVSPVAVLLSDLNRDSEVDAAIVNGSSPNVAVLSTSCPVSDLTLRKSSSLNIFQGQTAQFTMIVTNGGSGPTIGTVTVVDPLPPEFIATALGGDGWNCTLATVTCTRSDALAAGAVYPTITLTVTVRSNATSVTNIATVSGGGEINAGNNSGSAFVSVRANPATPPTLLVATATSPTQVSLVWDAVTNATQYTITRTGDGTVFQDVAAAASYIDTSVGPNMAYVYQVSGSNKDLATTFFFTDTPLVPTVRAVHFTELRDAVNAVRFAAVLAPAPWAETISPGVLIKATHLDELRTYLDQARAMIVLPALVYTPGPLIRAAHILELREGVR